MSREPGLVRLSLNSLYTMKEDLVQETANVDRKKLTLFLVLIGVLVVVVLGFFVPGLRVLAGILLILAILAFSVLQLGALLTSGFQSANPYVPSYAITMGEEAAKSNREGAMGCSTAFGVLGAILLAVGLVLGWGKNWWYELVGLAVLIMTVFIAWPGRPT